MTDDDLARIVARALNDVPDMCLDPARLVRLVHAVTRAVTEAVAMAVRAESVRRDREAVVYVRDAVAAELAGRPVHDTDQLRRSIPPTP